MNRRTLSAALAALTLAALPFLLSAPVQAQDDAAAALAGRAADALGGRERILGLKTLTMIGYGEMIDGFGLSNIAADRYAPERLNNLLEFERTFDLANERMRTRVRRRTNFTFANAPANLGLNRVNEVIDGDVAYNVNAQGVANRAGANAVLERRLTMFTHPLTAIRVALKPGTRLGPVRREDNAAVFAVVTAQGDEFDLAIDPVTSLPRWVRWMVPQINFGEVTYTTHFTAYMPVNGVQVPIGFTTLQDFRNQTAERLYIDRNLLDAAVEDMQAPASVRNAAAPAGRGGGPAQPAQLAPGVWRLGGSAVFEFDDHVVIYEVNGGEAAVLARIKQAGSLVPGKPLTHAIVSHHHDDHASGLRAAVSQGLTIISHYTNEETFRELTERKTTKYHDALGRNYQPMKFMPVRDHLELKDGRMEVDLYHVINNNHMASGLMAHVPAHRILVEADLTTRGWDYQWWGGSLMDNIEHRKIAVERVAPVHGQVEPLAEVVKEIERQVEGARALCAKTMAAQLYRPGCPVQYTREPASSR